MSNLARIHDIHPDVIHDFMETGMSKAIPVELQQYIQQLQWAIEVRTFNNERNISRSALTLRNRILASQHISLSVAACKERIYDAMNYFNVDCNVPEKVWLLDAADKLEDLSKLAIVANKFDQAHRMMKDAAEYRIKASNAISADDLTSPVFLLSPELNAEDLGFKDKNKKEIARKANEGFYIRLINDLPIERKDKKELLNDANIKELEDKGNGIFE
jgi:hypothetical protein